MLGIAVGRSTHKIVRVDDGEVVVKNIPNSFTGCAEVKGTLGCGSEVVFLGNRRWATPLAHMLRLTVFLAFILLLKPKEVSAAKLATLQACWSKLCSQA